MNISPVENISDGIVPKKKKLKIEKRYPIQSIIFRENLDADNLRLNIGGGNIRYSNCINLELEPNKDVDADVYGDITKGIAFDDETFSEILFLHVIEHIERQYHRQVFDEIWRLLKPNGRLIMGFPDFIECAKRFISNKYGGRWSLYHNCIFGRRSRTGDDHVTAIEQQDITNRLMSSGFVNIKYVQHTINATVVAFKGEQLNEFL